MRDTTETCSSSEGYMSVVCLTGLQPSTCGAVTWSQATDVLWFEVMDMLMYMKRCPAVCPGPPDSPSVRQADWSTAYQFPRLSCPCVDHIPCLTPDLYCTVPPAESALSDAIALLDAHSSQGGAAGG